MRIPTFVTVFVLLLVSAALAAAVPVAQEIVPAEEAAILVSVGGPDGVIEERDELENRQVRTIGVYYCTAFNYGGQCSYARAINRGCYNLQGAFDNTISAFNVDQGQGGCEVYANPGCVSSPPLGRLPIGYPGYSQFSGGVSSWNDVISSYICFTP